MPPSCQNHANASGNINANETIRLSNKEPNDLSLSSVTQDPSFKDSDAGGATQDDRSDDLLLVDAEGSSYNEGNTSAIISELQYLNNRSITEQNCDLTTSDEEKMRLRFNNKRNRNGNPSCTYEAFKPTRFNLYTNPDEPSWSTIKKDNSLESSSPTIKKKSVTGKLNPLIGAKLAREESPLAVCYSGGSEKQKYTVTQKYEDKIRALQQQRQKERSRRRNHSSRGADNIDQTFSRGENLDLTFSPDIHPPSYAEFCKYRSNPTATLPSPSVYFISDDGDSVAIQLNDFALGSPRVKNGEKKKKGKDKKQKACSPPVDRLNGFQQPHYLYNTENRPRKQNGILQNLVSHKRILQSYENGHHETLLESKANQGIDSYRKNNDYDDKRTQVDRNRKQSYKHDYVSASENDRERGKDENNLPHFEPSLNNRASSPVSVTYTGQIENDLSLNKSKTTNRLFGKKGLPSASVQHVTVKSGQICRPLSPRLAVAETENVTFKRFSPECRNEDVVSFIAQNIEDESFTPKDQSGIYDESCKFETSTPKLNKNGVDYERVSMECDVSDVAKNISKHLVESCEVEIPNNSQPKEIILLVTDLDAPDAASPLSRNGHHITRKGEFMWLLFYMSLITCNLP